jgi:hypothetical protein
MNFETEKEITLNAIKNSFVISEPFNHVFIENILSTELYRKLLETCKHYKSPNMIQIRNQDSNKFFNRRYNFTNSVDDTVLIFKKIFSDKDIKMELLSKFFVNPVSFIDNIKIHEKEFEVVFTEKDKFQNIHVDIPSKFLSLVFYLPEIASESLTDDDMEKNSTVLYDETMKPYYSAKYKSNSVCVFAPHFYSYHGFSTTIERTAIVLFYIDEKLLDEHDEKIAEAHRRKRKENDFETFKNNIFEKLNKFELIEYKNKNLEEIMKRCKINAPNGRVLK